MRRRRVTLERDVVRMLEEEARRQGRPLEQVADDAIRRGLANRYQVRPHKTALQPGIDVEGLNKLVDELEDEALIVKMADGAISRGSRR